MNIRRSTVPGWTAFAYVLVAIGWIVVSDWLLNWIGHDRLNWIQLGDFRGVAFVVVTAIALFLLLRGLLKRVWRAEKRMREQDRRWREALEQTGDGIVQILPDGDRMQYSPRWVRGLGYRPEEFGDGLEEWISRVHPDDAPAVTEHLARLRSGAEVSCRCEYRIRNKWGRYRWVLDRGHRLADSSAGGSGSVVVQRTDIHAAKLVAHTQSFLARIDLPASPRDHLGEIARFAAEEFAVAFVTVGFFDAASVEVRVVAGFGDGQPLRPFAYKLTGTPCSNVVAGDFCVHAAGVSREFPEDRWLAEEGIEAYVGMPLFEPGGRCVGLMVMLSRHALHEEEIESAVRLVALRASVELRRLALSTDSWNKDQLLKGLFEHMPSIVYVKDPSSRFLLVNDEFCRATGLARENIIGRTNAECFPPEYAEPMRQADLEALRSTQPVRVREHVGLTDGVHEFQSTKFALRDEAGAVYAVAGISVDITDQVRTEEALRSSEEKFRSLFRSARDAIMLIDAEGRYVDCNPSTEALLGARVAELIGQSVLKFAPPIQSDGEPSELKARRVIALAEGEELPVFDWRVRRSDGVELDCEASLGPVNWRGQRGLLAILRDVSERRRVQDQFRLLHAATQATPAGILITDASGSVRWVNTAFSKLTGYTPEEVLGQSTRMLRSGRHPPEFYRKMWDSISAGQVWVGELCNRRKDGTTYSERMTIAPVRDADGRICNYVAIKEDITVEKQIEQQLAQSQRLESVGLLASGIAHDLNNVLTPIVLSVELLKASDMAPVVHERLEIVAQAAQRGANIVKQVLTFARGVDGERTNVQPCLLVKEVARLAKETFPRQIDIQVETENGIPEIVANVTQLHQVLLNLAVNARDAMPMGGNLVLAVRHTLVDEARAKLLGRVEAGRFVEISVADTGTGIPTEVREHMFEPFFTTKPRGKGTGLGLSTVYGIVRSHGGAVAVDTALGMGTVFRVLFPVPRASHSRVEAVAASPRNLVGAGRVVLLVDDEEPIRVVGEHVLRRLGFEVVCAADGVQALSIFQLRPTRYSLAIVDHMMPRMGGLALIGALRDLAPALNIISSTGLGAEPGAEQAEIEELTRLGVRTRLPKPYSAADLTEALRRELDGT